MDVIYLIISIIASASVNILSSFFILKNKIHKNSAFLFNFISALAALCGWSIFYAIEGGFNPNVLLYSAIYGLSFVGAFIFLFLAVENGPLSFTTLIIQMSLVFTAIWGFIFWGTKVTTFSILGIILICVSLVLCIYKKENNKRFNFKWLLFAFLACASNASASIVMKSEQIDFNNQFGGEMMFFALLFAAIISGIVWFFMRKKIEITNVKGTWWIIVLAGLCNFLLNVFVILLAKTTMSPTIIYPTLAVGSLGLNILYSFVVNKEKLTVIQIIGLVIGAVSIVFLSI